MTRLLAVVVAMLALAATASASTVWYSTATDTGPDNVQNANGPAVGYGGWCGYYGIDDSGASSCRKVSAGEWDFAVHPTRDGDCAQLCGMGFVFWWSDYGRRPWTLPGDAFYVTASNAGGDLEAPPDSWWHGFICAQFTDTTTRQQVLACTQPWWLHAGHGTGDHWDPTINPDGGEWGGWNFFTDGSVYEITAAQFRSEMERANAQLGSFPLAGHLGRYSTNPADYSLVAVMCGLEGAGPHALLMGAGASCSGLTAYDDVPSSPNAITHGTVRWRACRRGRAGRHGAFYARCGRRPPRRRNYTIVGLGKGRWIYRPIKGTPAYRP